MGWVDMEVTVATGGARTWMIIVAGLIDMGMWGNEVLGNWGVTTASRGLLGFGSGLMVSGSQLRWKHHLEMVARVDGSFS